MRLSGEAETFYSFSEISKAKHIEMNRYGNALEYFAYRDVPGSSPASVTLLDGRV